MPAETKVLTNVVRPRRAASEAILDAADGDPDKLIEVLLDEASKAEPNDKALVSATHDQHLGQNPAIAVPATFAAGFRDLLHRLNRRAAPPHRDVWARTALGKLGETFVAAAALPLVGPERDVEVAVLINFDGDRRACLEVRAHEKWANVVGEGILSWRVEVGDSVEAVAGGLCVCVPLTEGGRGESANKARAVWCALAWPPPARVARNSATKSPTIRDSPVHHSYHALCGAAVPGTSLAHAPCLTLLAPVAAPSPCRSRRGPPPSRWRRSTST